MTVSKRPLKVFLCHAHADRDSVRGLYSRLIKDGADAWLDKEKLLGGADWEYEIRNAVRESDVVVVCHSKQFNERGFRQKEVKIALDEADLLPKGEIFIIPVRLEECEVLDDLKRWHWVDLFENDGYERLIRTLRARADRIGATLQIKKSWLTNITTPRFTKDKSEEPRRNLAKEKSEIQEDRVINLDDSMPPPHENYPNGWETEWLPSIEAEKPAAKPDEALKPSIKKARSQKIKASRKANTTITVAMIGFVGTIIAGLLGSPLIDKWLSPVPIATDLATTTSTLTAESIITAETDAPIQASETPMLFSSFTYKVQESDTCTSIAISFDVTVQSIIVSNNLSSTCSLSVGQVLKILPLTPTPVSTNTLLSPTPLPTEITDAKSVPMMLVPAGEFTMGSEDGSEDEKPSQVMYLNDFYMDKFEVTNKLYSDCVAANACLPPKYISLQGPYNYYNGWKLADFSIIAYYSSKEYENYPVVYVDWNMARNYCEWRGARLPTEAEWEKASRGTDARIYPWGSDYACQKSNIFDFNRIEVDPPFYTGPLCDDYIGTAPVGNFSFSPYGISDLSGNVSEWVSSLYISYPYNSNVAENLNEMAPRVYRGDSYFSDLMHSSKRKSASEDYTSTDLGFRCAYLP